MNLPNVLTLSRIVWAAILVFLLEERSLSANLLAVLVFALASLTDFYDGYFAKKCGLVSDFGRIMDPVADKVLLLSVFGVLTHLDMIPLWMFVAIAIREVAVTASRLAAFRKGRVLAAEKAGKIKTVVQITAVLVMLLYLVAEQWAPWFFRVGLAWAQLNWLLMMVVVVLTIYSGIDYFLHRKPS